VSAPAITPFKVAIPPIAEKVGGGVMIAGGLTTSVLAAKSIFVIGIASHAFPIIGTIIGIAMMILGAYLFYHARMREHENAPQLAPPAPQSKIEMEEVQKREPPLKVEVTEAPVPEKIIDIARPSMKEAEPVKQQTEVLVQPETPKTEEITPNLALTNSDKLQTASNLLQWGFIGAGLCGFAVPSALGFAASVGSGIATYCMLPEDASLIRKAMSLPIIGKKLIESIPGVNQAVQAYSLYTLATSATSKLSQCWSGLKSDPVNAVMTGAVHLFNLASGAAFAADSVGLINLKPDPVPTKPDPATEQDKPCDPYTPEECEDQIKRIKLATVYDNKDKAGNLNLEREKISEIVVKNHRDYANKWDLEHDVVTDNLVVGQCTDPSTGKAADCSPYMNKIQYYRMQCADPAQQGKLVIYGDDDLVYTNMGIDPLDAFNRLRNGKNTSVVMMREGADWAKYFKLPGYQSTDPRVSVNSGFIMGRIDEPFCNLIERTWVHRNTPMDPGPNVKDCPTVAFCKTHGITSLGDQTAVALALQDDLSVMDKTVTIVLPRDTSAPHRAHIAFNTLHRGGCHQEIVNGKLEAPFDIGHYDRNDYPDGIWREGDWNGQTAGFRVMGKYPLPGDGKGRCFEDPNQPIENIRLKKVLEMFPHKPEREFTLAVANIPDGNGSDAQYEHLTLANHREYAARHGAKFYHETDGNLLKDQCQHPITKTMGNCSSYWMKIQAIRKWLSQPNTSGKEEWLCIADDDGLYGRMKMSPSQVVDDMQGSSDAGILIVEEPQKSVSRINTGFIYVRKDDKSRNFVEQIWNERNTATDNPNHPTCFSHGACPTQVGSLHEQTGFDLALYRNPKALTDGTVKIVPIRAADRPYGLNTVYRKGCFYRDQAKWTSPVPINYEADDRATKTKCESEAGDYYFQAAGVPRVGRYCADPIGTKRPIRKEYIEQMLGMVKA
jgi:hypothetical protein